ncbi:MAG: MlaD family protein [Bacteroidales bacterium]|nr:MlaD family protein [Bacteroidales bacterium]
MKISKELKIGIFVVAVLVAAFFSINYLRGKDILDKEMEITARYENVEGLVASAPVYIKGYKAGQVSSVRYDRDSDDFEVTCSVLKEFRIPSDSKMTIYSVDIMGGKGIRIDLGTSGTFVEDGAVLSPDSAPDLIGGLTESIGPLLKKAANTLDSLSVAVSGINRMLGEQNQEHFARTLAHLEKTLANMDGISSAVNGKSGQIEDFIDNLESLSAKFSGIAEKADTTMSSVASITASLDETDIKGTVASFKALLESLNDPDGSLGKLMSDGSIYDSLDSLLNDVDSLVKKIEENPKKYIKISVF